ncbi:MAG: cytochrome P450 [Burkholderiaceae bacterium]
MSSNAAPVRIPQPEPGLLLGNLPDMDGAAPIQGLMQLAREYGPIYRLSVLGRNLVIVSSQALVHELCDEQRFEKRLSAPLKNIRELAGDGLFTAYNDEPNWGKAHRLLMPAFGPIGIRGMFEPMRDIAEQMMLRWERFGEHAVIDVADNMTRLTLDTIALCAFDYRFNSFYQNEMHPFVDAMVDALKEAGARGRRPKLANDMMLLTRRRYENDIRQLHEVADTLIAERRRDPAGAGKNDLLNLMLTGRDPQTGEGLSDENIRYQLVTFLIAGHETTSGLLTFTLYLLLRNPHILAKARARVDEVLGDETPSIEHMGQLRYLDQVLMESLRVWPTAPAFALQAKQDTLLAGQWPIRRDDIVFVLTPMLHRDPHVWEGDVEAFEPDRFERATAARRAPDAWKPFGNGQRACIGRPFAMQEAKLVLAMILQRFDLVDHDPAYPLRVAETLTLKPEGFQIRVKRRDGNAFARQALAPASTARRMSSAPAMPSPAMASTAPSSVSPAPGTGTPLVVLFGSNTGSSEAFAQRIANDAPANGFLPRIAPLDDYAAGLPSDGPVVIVTASYEGRPPDNARQFVSMVEEADKGRLADVRYTVFGCGNRQWARTWQAVPKRIDAALEAAGAARLYARGETDAGGDFFGGFDAWYAGLWPVLAAAYGHEAQTNPIAAALEVEIVRDGRSLILRQGELAHGVVTENRELVDMSAPLARSKRHVAIALPEGIGYRAGDYLAVLPNNPGASVDRALRRFALATDTRLVIHKRGGSVSALPIGHPISALELLSSYVELNQPATRAQLERLAQLTPCPPERAELLAIAEPEAYAREVLERRASVLDLLERTPACELEFAEFLAMLPPMRARQYSISSTPLAQENVCTLTIAVVDAPAHSGQGRFQGAASSMLAACAPGTRVPVAVRPSQGHFHPPASPRTPMIMVCAGSGLAPFRGFIQERALQAAAGQAIGASLLFFGCDHPDVDDIYRDELDAWEAAGVVSVRRAFSAAPQGDVVFVQDRLWQDRAEVAALFRQGANIYVCGDGQRMAPAVRRTFVEIYREAAGVEADAAEAWADAIERETGRYVADVFA